MGTRGDLEFPKCLCCCPVACFVLLCKYGVQKYIKNPKCTRPLRKIITNGDGENTYVWGANRILAILVYVVDIL